MAEIKVILDDGSEHIWFDVDEEGEKFSEFEATLHRLYGVADQMNL